MTKTAKIIVLVVAVLLLAGVLAYHYRWSLISYISSPGINSRGGDITITNARIWTGDPDDPWKTSMTVRDGKIVAMNADEPAGRVIDAEGRLVVPGFWDSHTHPQTPYVLFSYKAPMLFDCESVDDVQKKLKEYVEAHPEDRYPRLWGWMDKIFKDGQKPTRQMIDAVVSDKPVYLVHHSGHAHWANTKALELAGVLENDPPNMKGTGIIERDPETGLATGFLSETELASTHGILLESVKRLEPLSFDEMVAVQTYILNMYSKVGVTGIWTKDGDLEITRIYEQILRNDALPVRAVLDHLYTWFSDKDDLERYAEWAREVAEADDLPKGFLRADGVKLLIDMPYHMWMFEPYANRPDFSGHAVFDHEEMRKQVLEADRLGLQVNLLVLGDRAVHEGLNLFEEAIETNPPRARRHTLEHADWVKDSDLPRIKELGAVVIMNPIGLYPDMDFQQLVVEQLGEERTYNSYEPWRKYIDAGAVVVMGSDFPLAPMDPLLGMHILVNGTDINGQPEGGLYPHKHLTIEEALRTHTTNAAYAAFEEDRLGMLKEGYEADFVVLSDDILAPDFQKENLWKVKVQLTVFNGHILHEDFSDAEKVIEFGGL